MARQRILVVEDVLAVRELLLRYLADLDCDIDVAGSGANALDLITRRRPDLVLLDVGLPGIDGLEVCRSIKESDETRLVPVVIVTALAATHDRVRALDAGADDFLAKPVERVELLARVRSLLRLKRLYDSLDDATRVIFALARAVEARDAHTEAHTERVAANARRLGEVADVSDELLDDLFRGGMIHDIGKIGIPDGILLKPAALTSEEREAMRRHTAIGEAIAGPLRSAANLLQIVRHHPEWWDGSGYPDGLRGEEIPLGARIVSICDSYDALVSDRPYRRGRSPDEAIEILREGAGTQWDPHLLEMFIEQVVHADEAAPIAVGGGSRTSYPTPGARTVRLV
jgi:putative two-component system response regulator